MTTASDIRFLTEVQADRASNDANNKKREAVFELLGDIQRADELARMKLDPRWGSNWVVVDEAFHRLTDSLGAGFHGGASTKFVGLKKRGGRGYNYDFDMSFAFRPDGLAYSAQIFNHSLQLELKKGGSIFDQPQFLSLGAIPGNVILPPALSYAEFFFDRYVGSVAAGVDAPPRPAWTTCVWSRAPSTQGTSFLNAYTRMTPPAHRWGVKSGQR